MCHLTQGDCGTLLPHHYYWLGQLVPALVTFAQHWTKVYDLICAMRVFRIGMRNVHHYKIIIIIMYQLYYT